MIPAIKSEFRKLLTIRSTYLISAAALLLIGFFAFYGQGYKAVPMELDKLLLAGTLVTVANFVSIFGAIIALLLMAHEYRHNTIIYTLTASNSRSKVLASKIITAFVFIFIFSTIITALSLILTIAGVAAAGHSLPHQEINYLTFFAKSIFLCEAFAMFSLLLAALVRNLVGAIVILFIVPNTVEGLLGILLKDNSVYLPFTALQRVVMEPSLAAGAKSAQDGMRGALTPLHGAEIFLLYLAIGWVVTWYLFLRRDAT